MGNATEQASERQSAPKTNARRWPPVWWRVLLAICLGLGGWLQRPSAFDHQMANILTWALALLAFAALSFWFVFRSTYPLLLRMLYPATVMAGIALFFGLFRLEQVTGEMTPIFAYRFAQRSPEQLVPPPQTDVASIDLKATGPFDFPQFLGPLRNAVYSAVALHRDWGSHPPQECWRIPIGAGWSGFAAVNGYGVTLEQRGDQECVTCYEIETGKLVWVHSHAARHKTVLGGLGPRSTPTLDAGRVYAQGATGILVCLDGATGELLWQKDLPAEFGVSKKVDAQNIAWGRSGSPLVVDNLVIIPAGGPGGGQNVSLAAYDKNTGQEVWRGGNRQISYGSPVLATLAGVRQVLSVNENNLSSHDLQTGEVLWRRDWPGNSNANASVSQPVVVDAQNVLLSKGYGGGAEFLHISRSSVAQEGVAQEGVAQEGVAQEGVAQEGVAQEGVAQEGVAQEGVAQEGVAQEGVAWRVASLWDASRLLKTKFCNISLLDDRYAVGLSDGILECVDLEQGRRKWKKGRFGHGQILRVGDVILVLAESGGVAMVDASPEKYRLLGEHDVFQSKCWNTLCLYGSYLLVRNDREAVCLQLALAPDKNGTKSE